MTCIYATDFSEVFLVKKKGLWRSQRPSKPFCFSCSPFALLVAYCYSHERINLCWYLCQVGMWYKIKVQNNLPGPNSILMLILTSDVICVLRGFTQAKNYFRKGKKILKRSLHILHPKGESCVFKMELECTFGYKCWIVNSCNFFCFQGTWNFSWECLLQYFIVYY